MDKYKLGNLIKKEMLQYYNNSEIIKQKFSYSFLTSLFNTYPVVEMVFKWYCCKGEDYNCWIDEETCWMQVSNTDYDFPPRVINNKVHKRVKEIVSPKNNGRYINSRRKTHTKLFDICKRNIFVGENNKNITVCIPFRDINKFDLFLTFDKKPLL